MPGTSTEQVVDKGIRQKSIRSFHSIHSFPDGSAFCPGAPKRVPSDSEKHRRVYTSSNVCHSHEWRVDTTSGMTLNKQNECLRAVRHAVEKKLRVYTAFEEKVLKEFCHDLNCNRRELHLCKFLPFLLFLFPSQKVQQYKIQFTSEKSVFFPLNLLVKKIPMISTWEYY